MKVAFCQFEPALCDRVTTQRRLEPLLERAAEADLVVLPELCNSGYELETKERVDASAENPHDGPFATFLREACRLYDFDVVTGLNERAEEGCYNSALLIGPEGTVSVYRKLHLFSREHERFLPGDRRPTVIERRGLRIGMLVCFDWVFPEVWRRLALDGVDLIAHPSNLVLPGLAQRGVPVHALVNRIHVVTANRVGHEGELNFTGRSLIVSPRGETLVEAPAEGEFVGVAAIDVAASRDKRITPWNDVFADRRPEFYG